MPYNEKKLHMANAKDYSNAPCIVGVNPVFTCYYKADKRNSLYILKCKELQKIYFPLMFRRAAWEASDTLASYQRPFIPSGTLHRGWFSNRSTNSPDFAENTDFSKKKSAIGKNPPFWKIQKLFFMDLRFRNWTYI